MKIKRAEVSIDKADPFKEDILDRKQYAELLTNLLGTIEQPFVLSVSSPWGTGKTTFVDMWRQHLSNESFACVHFNAWQNQFGQGPFISFMAEINKDIVMKPGGASPEAKQYFEDAKKVGGVILKRAVPAIAKLATYGILDMDEISEAVLANSLGEIVDDQIKSYESNNKTIAKFRDNLQNFVTALNTKADSKKPLIFIIDELDRCQPSYVIDLLEKINHIFNIPGIIFVLVLDREQISHSVKSIYGDMLDVHGYLRRFIDLDYRLPKPSTLKYVEHLINEFEITKFVQDVTYLREMLYISARLADKLSLSLRAQNQCFAHLSIALRTTKVLHSYMLLQYVVLTAIKAANPEKYYEFIGGKLTPHGLIEWLNQQQKSATKPTSQELNTQYITEAVLFAATVSEENGYNETIEFFKTQELGSTDPREKKRAQRLSELITDISTMRQSGRLDRVANIIESLDVFQYS